MRILVRYTELAILLLHTIVLWSTFSTHAGNNEIQAVLFDLDEVLIGHKESHGTSYSYVIDEAATLCHEIQEHASVTLGILSNASRRHAYHLALKPEAYAILKQFPHRFFLGNKTLKKPNPKVYQLVAEKLHLQPEQCIFIDDKIENVAGASHSGMKGIHFDVNMMSRVRHQLYMHNLLPPITDQVASQTGSQELKQL